MRWWCCTALHDVLLRAYGSGSDALGAHVAPLPAADQTLSGVTGLIVHLLPACNHNFFPLMAEHIAQAQRFAC